MRLKLKEAAQPISKLDYNIQNIVLPTLASYGFTFTSKPTKLNQFEYVYNGYSDMYNTYTKLDMVTSNKEMDVFNEEGNEFQADLYIYLYLGIDEVMRGPISSKDPSTITIELEENPEINAAIDNAVPQTEEKKKEETVYAPASDTSSYGTMSAKKWREELKKQEDMLEDAKKELNSAFTQEEIYKLIQDHYDNGTPLPDVYQNYRDALDKYRYFVKQIYPLI